MIKTEIENVINIGNSIKDMVDKTGIDYIDAVLELCRINNYEVEVIGDIIKKDQNITKAIKQEAQKKNLVKMEDTFTLEFASLAQ